LEASTDRPSSQDIADFEQQFEKIVTQADELCRQRDQQASMIEAQATLRAAQLHQHIDARCRRIVRRYVNRVDWQAGDASKPFYLQWENRYLKLGVDRPNHEFKWELGYVGQQGQIGSRRLLETSPATVDALILLLPNEAKWSEEQIPEPEL
jgi:hypothetical protein